MPDNDGYPTKEELRQLKILAHPISKSLPKDIWKSTLNLLDLLEAIWHWPEWGFVKRNGFTQSERKKCTKLELHTGGWSGNEEIIGYLETSWFWWLYWETSVRGGHFYFEIPKRKLGEKNEKE